MRIAYRLLPVLSIVLASVGCSVGGRTSKITVGPAQLFDGMGRHHRTITTSSKEAQKYFDQGLTWAFGFNHDEAIRSFTKAGVLDPNCAMAWWGIALCHGPHINNPVMPPERSAAAWIALQKALAVKQYADPTERALIDALAERYAFPTPKDRKPLDQAYAAAMRKLWQSHRYDPDVGTLYAESMMDLRPWDLWTKDGKPQSGTEEILAVLEQVLHRDPYHPGANHLYIHAVEASPEPDRGIVAADRLRNLVPTSSHLVHMPSHIDVLTGQWAKASQQNELAVEADKKYCALSHEQDFYRVYMTHNWHMLCYASMMEGRFEAALHAARELVKSVPGEYAKKKTAFVDPYMCIVYDVFKRFGRWDDMLKEPAPASYLPITNAMWRFNRAVAFAAKGQVQDAEREQAKFRRAAQKVQKDAVMAINPAHRILSIAEHFLNGEISFRRGEIDDAVAELKKAVSIEDDLLYMEPPEWVQPARHTLGAVLLSAGRYRDAEQVYREDLSEWPGNGWSLYGLSRSLQGQGDAGAAADFQKRFREAWSRADTPIATSCLCIPKT